jgi:hypothetical protein
MKREVTLNLAGPPCTGSYIYPCWQRGERGWVTLPRERMDPCRPRSDPTHTTCFSLEYIPTRQGQI